MSHGSALLPIKPSALAMERALFCFTSILHDIPSQENALHTANTAAGTTHTAPRTLERSRRTPIAATASLLSTPPVAMLRSLPSFRLPASVSTRQVSRAVNGTLVCRWQPTQQQQTRNAHAISNPTLANIEKRWEAMPPQEQADLWMALRDRMKVDWNEMTLQEKKAAYWIAFGPHGPRAGSPPGEGRKVFSYTVIGVLVGFAIFAATHLAAGEHPSTMNKEYQEATNEYFKENKIEPITGVSSEGYTGKGQVQSPPAHK